MVNVVPRGVTGTLVTPVPPIVGVAFTELTEYTNPFSVVLGQTPKVVAAVALNLAAVVVMLLAVFVTATGETLVLPVPVKLLVGELLPAVVLVTVIVAVFGPVEEGVNVTT